METDKCDWCRMEYPRGTWDCYYELDVMGEHNKLVHHVICSDCYDRLKPVKGTHFTRYHEALKSQKENDK